MIGVRLLRKALAGAALALAAAAVAAEQQVYNLGAFDAIDISGAADVRFQNGASDEVAVQGDDAAQKRVALEVRRGTLAVESGGNWKFWNGSRPQIVVTARRLARLKISGAASFTAPGTVRSERLAISISGSATAWLDDLRADAFSFESSGGGDADVAGEVQELAVSISGRSEFRGERLQARRARVAIGGLGDVKLWATDDLALSISGIGRVEYWGTPTVRRSISGVSTVVDRGPKPAR